MRTITSDRTYVEVDDETVTRIHAQAHTDNVDWLDVDELVHDCCAATGARHANTGDDVDPDTIYEVQGQLGANVNNDGPRAQVAFLIAELGDTQTTDALRALTGR